jgi:hypothetical protein
VQHTREKKIREKKRRLIILSLIVVIVKWIGSRPNRRFGEKKGEYTIGKSESMLYLPIEKEPNLIRTGVYVFLDT